MTAAIVPVGGKRCSRCGQIKPLDCFYWLPTSGVYMSACKTCRRIYRAEQERGRDRATYEARPEVRARTNAQKRAYAGSEKGRATAAAYRASERGQLCKARRHARYKARHHPVAAVRERALASITWLDAAIRRLGGTGP